MKTFIKELFHKDMWGEEICRIFHSRNKWLNLSNDIVCKKCGRQYEVKLINEMVVISRYRGNKYKNIIKYLLEVKSKNNKS